MVNRQLLKQYKLTTINLNVQQLTSGASILDHTFNNSSGFTLSCRLYSNINTSKIAIIKSLAAAAFSVFLKELYTLAKDIFTRSRNFCALPSWTVSTRCRRRATEALKSPDTFYIYISLLAERLPWWMLTITYSYQFLSKRFSSSWRQCW